MMSPEASQEYLSVLDFAAAPEEAAPMDAVRAAAASSVPGSSRNNDADDSSRTTTAAESYNTASTSSSSSSSSAPCSAAESMNTGGKAKAGDWVLRNCCDPETTTTTSVDHEAKRLMGALKRDRAPPPPSSSSSFCRDDTPPRTEEEEEEEEDTLLGGRCGEKKKQRLSPSTIIPRPPALLENSNINSSINSSSNAPVLPDPKTTAVDPDTYLAMLIEARLGVTLKITPALDLADFFPAITEAQVAAYSMEIVCACRENSVSRLREFHASRGRDCLDCCNRFGEGLLNMACRRGFRDIVEFLLSPAVGLSARIRDDYGRTPLHDACWSPEPQLEICSWLLAIDPALFLIKDKRGYTPFQYARKGDWPVWRQFLFDNQDRLDALGEPDIVSRFT